MKPTLFSKIGENATLFSKVDENATLFSKIGENVTLFVVVNITYSSNVGGDERIRTDGLLRARQALSHLSYTPLSLFWWAYLDLNQRPHAYQARALTS